MRQIKELWGLIALVLVMAGSLAYGAASITHSVTAIGTNDNSKQISVNAWNAPHKINPGSEGQILKTVGGVASWANYSGAGMANPMTTSGDIIYGGTSGTPTRLGKGTDGQVLKLASGVPVWGTYSGASLTNPMTTAEDLIVGDTGGTPKRLAKGTDGQVLKMASGAVAWGTDSTGGGGGLTNEAGTNADVTMAVGKMYVVDMTAWATADRTFTLPATAAAGDQIGVTITGGNASYELILKPGTGDTINGGSAAAEWSRLFITGETVIFRCTTADSAWVVEYDGRIAQKMSFRLTTAATSETAATFTVPSASNGVWTSLQNTGNSGSTSTSRFVPRRAGFYQASARGASLSITATKYTGIRIWDGTNTLTMDVCTVGTTNNVGQASVAVGVPLATTEYLEYQYYTEEGNKGLSTGAMFAVMEIF